MDREHLQVRCKNDNDIRKIFYYPGSDVIAYTTFSPNELKSRKVCVRHIPITILQTEWQC